jgi:hypothetical protein
MLNLCGWRNKNVFWPAISPLHVGRRALLITVTLGSSVASTITTQGLRVCSGKGRGRGVLDTSSYVLLPRAHMGPFCSFQWAKKVIWPHLTSRGLTGLILLCLGVEENWKHKWVLWMWRITYQQGESNTIESILGKEDNFEKLLE